MYNKLFKKVFLIFSIPLAFLCLTTTSGADVIEAYIVLDPMVENAQSMSLTDFGIQTDGTAPHLFDLILVKTTTEPLTNACLEFVMSLNDEALITAISEEPFDINVGATQIIADNNDLMTGNLDYVPQGINLTYNLTEAGEQIITDLKGEPELPPGDYSIRIDIYYCDSQQPLGQAEVHWSLLANPVYFDLISPGDNIGSNALIETRRPFFDLDGEADSYRFIVVRAGDDDPEAIFANAILTPADGELNGDEMMDTNVPVTSFTYPASGVQPLQPGITYYWQVLGQVVSLKTGLTDVPSAIWEFTIIENATNETTGNAVIDDCLRSILGQDYANRYGLAGFDLQSIELNGQTISNSELSPVLQDLRGNVDQGKISILETAME